MAETRSLRRDWKTGGTNATTSPNRPRNIARTASASHNDTWVDGRCGPAPAFPRTAPPTRGVVAGGDGVGVLEVGGGELGRLPLPKSTVARAEKGRPLAVPRRTTGCGPASGEAAVAAQRTCDSRALAAAANAADTAAAFSALATDPPPAVAKACSTPSLVSSVLKRTTSTRVSDVESAAMTGLTAPACWALGTMVSPPSLSRRMLRSPALPRAAAALVMPLNSAVSPLDLKALTVAWTLVRSRVGWRSTPAVLAKERTPTLTSAGTDRRKVATAARTVAMPVAPIEPLVSMTSIVVRLRVAAWTRLSCLTGRPPIVAVTEAVSTSTVD